ncbi:MAG: BlaI/MecI/CopY family transcriptional regulator [Gammaproteobacteria bacterium]|nr:BlaI/MecI/CopY family transcriptional regulator [Gammaproteobacteria bacterium]
MKRKRQLGDLQLAIMRVLWERGEAPAIEVHEALFEERRLAVTTIKTMLRKLEEYGCVEHRTNGRQFMYRPAIAEADVRKTMVASLVTRLFSGDSTALVNHLVRSGEIDPDDLEGLKTIVSSKRKGDRKGESK